MTSVVPDPNTPESAKIAARLRDEVVVWLTTVDTNGTPQPAPVWFLWENDSFLIYSLNTAKRLDHIRRNPRVSLNFDSDNGGDVLVFIGEAEIVADAPTPDRVPAYVQKYGARIARISDAPQTFAARYSVAIRVTPVRMRSF